MGQFGDRNLQPSRSLREHALHLPATIHGAEAGDGGDPPRACRHALLGGDPHHADLPGARHVRAAAEFAAHAVHRHHPHDVGVLLTKEHHRAGVAGFRQGQELRRHRHGGQRVFVDHRLDLVERVAADAACVSEVESQQVGIDLRSLLHRVAAEIVLQRRMEEVGGGVGTADRRAAAGIDFRSDRLAEVERALAQVAGVEHEAALSLRIADVEAAPLPRKCARVAHLAARFAVEARAIEHDRNRRRMADLAERVAELTLRDDADHLAVGLGRVIADELGAVHGLFERVERARCEHLHAGAGARPLAVRVHRLPETVPVEAAVPLGGERLEQFRRKAVGGVEFGSLATADQAGAGTVDRREQLFDAVESAVDRREKRLLFALDHAGHPFDRLSQFRVGLSHHRGDGGRQLVKERFLHAHLPAVEHGSPQQTLDDIFLLVVARQHVLVDGKRAGADVIGDPPHPAAVVARRDVGTVADFRHRFDDRLEDVDVEVAVDALQHRCRSLQAHARVDIPAGKRMEVVRR